jgi:O-methyltransferase
MGQLSARLRMCVKENIARVGLGPFRGPMQTLVSYAKFGDWLRELDCKAVFQHRFDLYNYLNTEILKEAPIDYLEFGVFAGLSIRRWTELNQAPGSRFLGFDSFEGLPEAWEHRFHTDPKGTFDTGGHPPVIDDPRVEFVKGLFQDTIPGFAARFKPSNRLVVHLDADLYTSTLYVLCSIDQLISRNTVLIFDEFSDVDHEFRALADWSRSFRRQHRVLGYTKPYYSQVAMEVEV